MTADALLSVEGILDALATAPARRIPPRAAMQQAIERWPEVGPVLLALLQEAASGGDLSERNCEILLPGVFLMAQVREKRGLQPLCSFAADGDRLEEVIGDAVTEDLHMILARLYDGDQTPLRSLIEAAGADEFVRDAALGALVWLTAAGRIEKNETARYLRELPALLQTQGHSFVWHGWQQGIARLGLEELAPLVEDAFARNWVDPSWLGLEDFRTDLRAAQQAAAPTDGFGDWDDARLDDVAEYLSTWSTFQPEAPPAPRPAARLLPGRNTIVDDWPSSPRRAEPPPPQRAEPPPSLDADGPVRNPYRHVGRNDPCPCGSGKKFKKCCLEMVR